MSQRGKADGKVLAVGAVLQVRADGPLQEFGSSRRYYIRSGTVKAQAEVKNMIQYAS